MDGRVCVSEKQFCDTANSQGCFSEITIKRYEIKYFLSLAFLYKDFYKEVLDEDLNYMYNDRFNMVEAKILQYLDDGADIWILFNGDRGIGFLIAHYIFDSILIVRSVYFVPEYRRKGLFVLFRKLYPNIKRIFSQTSKDKSPEGLKLNKGNKFLINETPGLYTWEYRLEG